MGKKFFSYFKPFFSNRLLLVIAFLSILFDLLLIFNVSPALRGPVDRLLESHWPYYFVNTYSKIWMPAIPVFLYFLLYRFWDEKKKKDLLFISLLVLIVFLFQLSLVAFSRFGINILFRRMADPGINGYFTAATQIKDIHSYLSDFSNILPNLYQHSIGHPPGGVLLIMSIIYILKSLPFLVQFLSSFVHLSSSDSLSLWNSLNQTQRISAIISAFFLHFVASLSIIPVYYLAKNLFSKKAAIRSVFLYAVIPSLSFFALLLDPFYAFFVSASALFLVLGIKNKSKIHLFVSGLIFSIGTFFSISIFPVLLFFILVMFVLSIFYKRLFIRESLIFALGFFIFQILLMFAGYNPLTSIPALIRHQDSRQYFPWLIYNPYDFFLFLGLPISMVFIFKMFESFKKSLLKLDFNKILLASFLFIFLILVISGFSRGEAGRIWLPLMIFPVFQTAFLSLKTFNKEQFGLLLFLVVLQVILMEEYWVPIW